MLILRLKQCECALNDGRLDAAYEVAKAADLRADRRGQDLVGRLARALVERGQYHASNNRISEASADCEKAAALGGNLPEVAELRSAIVHASAARQDADRVRGQALAAARRHLDGGQLTLGAGLLEAIDPTDARADALKQDLAARRAALQSAITKASAAFSAQDWETAIEHLRGVAHQFPNDTQLRALASQITQHVTEQINPAIESGRLDLATSLLSRLDRLGHVTVELDQIRRTLQQCRLAIDLVSSVDAQKSLEVLRRLAPMWPKAKWMSATAEQLRQLSDALQQIRSGPLGLAGMGPVVADPHETRAAPPADLEPARNGNAPKFVKQNNGAKLFLQVDGVGSYQVVSQNAITIGPVSSSASPDIALMAGAGIPTVTLTRADGDYFLQSREPVLINDKPTTGKLLSNGDRIAMGSRCRLTFRRPSAASGTAVLDLSGARLARGDVRQVLLLDREILIGPGATAHVRSDDLASAAVLQGSNGRFVLRSTEPIQVNGQPAQKPAEIAAGAHVRVGPVTFVLTRE